MRTIAFFHRAASSLLFIWLGSGPWLAASEKTAVTSGPPSGQATISIDVTDQPAVVFDWWDIWGEAEARIVTIQERHIGYGDLRHSQLNVEYNVPQDSAPKRYFRKQTITNSWAADFFYYSAQTIQGSMTLAARVNDIGETEVVQGQMNDERTNRWMDVQGENMYGPFGPEYTARWTRSGTPRSGFAQRLPVFDGTTTYNDGQPGSADQTSSLADANPTPFWAMGGVGWAFWGGDYMGHSGENLSLDSPFAAQPAEWTLTRAMWNSTGAGAYGAVTSAQFSYSLELSEEDTLADVQARLDADRQAGTFGNIPWGTDRWISYGGNKIVDHSTFDGSSVWLYNYHSDFASSGEVYEQAAQVRIAVPEELRLTGVAYRARFIQYFYDDLDPTETAQVKKIFEIELKEGQWESLAITPVIPAEDGLTVIEFFSLMAEPINPHPILPQPPSANPVADTAPLEYATIRPEIIQQGIADGHGARAVLEGSTTRQQIHLSDSWGFSSDWPSATATWSIVPGATAQVRLWRWTDDGSMLGVWSQVSPSENLMPYFDSSSDYLFAEALGFGRATVRITITVNGQTVQDDIDVRTATAELAVDADRDGNITLSNQNPTDQTTAAAPFRFWINDDDDQGPAAGDNMAGQPENLADYNNATVDSVRDLVDFFPVFLDIKQLMTVLPHTTDGITYKLKQADGVLNFIYTNKTRAQAFEHHTKILTTGFGPAFTQAAGEAATEQITAAGATLNNVFLDGVKNNDWGVILVEGCAATTAPLRLVVEENGAEILEIMLNIKISPVEQMFRHVNLAAQVDEYESYGSGNHITPPKPGLPTNTAQPADYPDSLTNGKYFVFIHGFNVDADSARGWNAELFKRMHTMGSKGRFVGVQWNGSPPSIIPGKYLDYHKAVFQAFQTGDLLAGALNFTSGADVTVAAHSLGSVVTSHAIQNGGFRPTRYYMINAATAIEAFSLSDATGQFDIMRHESWVPYASDSRLYASKWHELFASTPSDHRNALTWKTRFENIVLTSGLAHNFFSGEEDVVADGDQIDDASIFEIVLEGNLPAVATGEYSWKLQELVKGANVFSSAASLVLERLQGGWGFSYEWNILEDVEPGPGTNWQSHRRPPSQTDSIPSEGLKTEPFFRRFLESDLMSDNVTTASNKAGEKKVKYDLLARAIPAMSNAAAANRLDSLGDRNYDMPSEAKKNGWYDAGNRWRHSDFCNVALPYVYPMFQEMILRGGLNQ